MTDSREDKRLSRGRQKPQALFPVAGNKLDLPGDYQATLADLKQRIKNERLQLTLTANATMILLYWDIGQVILDRQNQQGWGAKIIDHLSEDLKLAFPEMNGFSPRNLKYMRKFAQQWPEREIVQRVAAQIPWRSNQLLLDLNLYLSAVDDLLRHPDDKPTIGLLLCKSKNDVVVEYALDGYRRPIGVAQWETQLSQSLPEDMKGSLPSIEEIEAELKETGGGE